MNCPHDGSILKENRDQVTNVSQGPKLNALCKQQGLVNYGCPKCGREIIGSDADSQHERNRIRWKNATRHWKK